MSHFTVAVITPNLNRVEDLLAPFQENNMGNCPEEYLAFFDVEEEYQRSYESESTEYVQMEDGRLVSPYDSRFYVTSFETMMTTLEAPTHLQRVQIPHREKYPTFDDYMMEYVGYTAKDEKTGKWGYWENPNAKWDWWEVGGRWSDMLLLRSGEQTSAAPIKDIFFIEQEHHEEISVEIEGMSVPVAIAPKLQISVAEASQEWNQVMTGQGLYKPEYYIKRYVNKESFVREILSISTYAVLTPDGNWHASGEMGWFGTSSESPEEARKFSTSFYDTFIKNANPEHFLVIVDCHI